MIKKVNLTGKSKEELIKQYLEKNNLTENDIYLIEQEVEGKLFSSKKYSIDVITKESVIEFIKEYFQKISELMNLTINIEIRQTDDIYNILLVSDNNAILIGKEGRTLEALQTLLRQTINNQINLHLKINLDASNYKAKKNKNLEYEVKKIAREVLKSKVDAKLDPMTSFERRIVHNVINDFKNLYTESEGETPNRYVVIKYKEE